MAVFTFLNAARKGRDASAATRFSGLVSWFQRGFAKRKGANPVLAKTLKQARRLSPEKQLEMARVLFDNIRYFDIKQEQGEGVRQVVSCIYWDIRSMPQRPNPPPMAMELLKLWACDKLRCWDGRDAPALDQANERLLRQFIFRNLPDRERDEINANARKRAGQIH